MSGPPRPWQETLSRHVARDAGQGQQGATEGRGQDDHAREQNPALSHRAAQPRSQIAQGQRQVVTVRFAPTSTGPLQATLSAGGAQATLTGNGTASPVGTVTLTPGTHDFGSVQVGQPQTQTFTLSHTSGSTATGTVSISGPGFQIASGGGTYSLQVGQSRPVVVVFTPQATGGASGVFAPHVKEIHHVDEHLVLEGLLACLEEQQEGRSGQAASPAKA